MGGVTSQKAAGISKDDFLAGEKRLLMTLVKDYQPSQDLSRLLKEDWFVNPIVYSLFQLLRRSPVLEANNDLGCNNPRQKFQFCIGIPI